MDIPSSNIFTYGFQMFWNIVDIGKTPPLSYVIAIGGAIIVCTVIWRMIAPKRTRI